MNAFTLLLVISTGEDWNDMMGAFIRESSLTFQCVDNPSFVLFKLNNCKYLLNHHF